MLLKIKLWRLIELNLPLYGLWLQERFITIYVNLARNGSKFTSTVHKFVNLARNGDDFLRKLSPLRKRNRLRYAPFYNIKNSWTTDSDISTHLQLC